MPLPTSRTAKGGEGGEVVQSVSAAFHSAVRGMRAGYKLTRSALKSFPVERLRWGVKDGVLSPGDIRRLFQLKYGAKGRRDDATRVAARSSSSSSQDVDEDEEPLTDAQVHERVEGKFFNKAYDAVRNELLQMHATYADDEKEIQQERAAAEARILELQQQCQIVSTTLKRRVLLHHREFVSGIEGIRSINDSLLQTSSDCKRTRGAIRKCKAATASQISLLASSRTRANVQITLALLEAMDGVVRKRNQLLALVSNGRLVEATKLLREEGPVKMEDRLRRIYVMKTIIEEWNSYRDDPAILRQCIEGVLVECLITKFTAATYRNVLESATVLGGGLEDTHTLVAQLLWRDAAQILVKSLVEMSYVKNEAAPMADIAAGIHADYVLLCFRQLAARMLDFFCLYVTVRQLHREAIEQPDAGYMEMHTKTLGSVTEVGCRIGLDLVERLTLLLANVPLDQMDVERVLHLFVMVSALVGATAVLGMGPRELASAHTRLKSLLQPFMEQQFQAPKAKEVVYFMMQDSWTMADFSALSLRVVCPIASDDYESQLKAALTYVAEPSHSSVVDNPFYAAAMLSPPDLSALLQMETFAQYWSSVKAGGSASPLAAAASMPPTVLTSSAVCVYNTLTEYVARVAVRYPPLAPSIFGWTCDLVCLYLYTVADNFVSISKSIPIEQQADFSPLAQEALAEMRVAGTRTLGAVDGAFLLPPQFQEVVQDSNAAVRFPPRVWGHIRGDFVSAAHQYALCSRVVACESCVTLAFLQEAVARSLAPLLPRSVLEEHLDHVKKVYEVAVELLHVCMHRLCQAIYPLESVCAEIAKLKPHKGEVRVSQYVHEILAGMKAVNEARQPMPTPALETLFLQRFVFSVQATLMREYSKLSKRLQDIFVMQMQVDAQNFQQQAESAFGRHCIVMPDYLVSLIKTGFYMEDHEQRLEWLRCHHAFYNATDLMNWFSCGDRAFKLRLEGILNEELKHHDAIPLSKFVQQF